MYCFVMPSQEIQSRLAYTFEKINLLIKGYMYFHAVFKKVLFFFKKMGVTEYRLYLDSVGTKIIFLNLTIFTTFWGNFLREYPQTFNDGASPL